MCFTGGFALAMMVDTSVVAPVLAQPSAPFAVSPNAVARPQPQPGGPRRRQGAGRRRAARCSGLRFTKDPAVGRGSAPSSRSSASAFIKVEFAGIGHSTVTEQRQQEGVDRVLAFFEEKLR